MLQSVHLFGCSWRQNANVCFKNNYSHFSILYALFSFLEYGASSITKWKNVTLFFYEDFYLKTWEFENAAQQRNVFCLHGSTCPNHKNIEIARKRSSQNNPPPHICPLNFENEHMANFCKTIAHATMLWLLHSLLAIHRRRLGMMVDQVGVGHVFLFISQFSIISIISPLL